MTRTLVLLVAVSLVAAACAAPAPPAATLEPLDPAPTPTSPAASPTAFATPAAPTPTSPPGSPVQQPTSPPAPDYGAGGDDYGYGYGGGGSATPTPAAAAATLEVATKAGTGDYLLGPSGLALYTFDSDHPGMSMCTGGCAENWPPLTVAAGEQPTAGSGVDGMLGVIERAEGTRQVTYDEAPLYYFVGDSDADDTTGDGLNGVWHLARP